MTSSSNLPLLTYNCFSPVEGLPVLFHLSFVQLYVHQHLSQWILIGQFPRSEKKSWYWSLLCLLHWGGSVELSPGSSRNIAWTSKQKFLEKLYIQKLFCCWPRDQCFWLLTTRLQVWFHNFNCRLSMEPSLVGQLGSYLIEEYWIWLRKSTLINLKERNANHVISSYYLYRPTRLLPFGCWLSFYQIDKIE